jgi:DNA-directed RNA polymerase omega subunit
MSDALVPVVTEEVTETPAEPPRPPAPPIRSRFLFVDVAAQRAKQLRRGARPRVETPDAHKLERVAMREVSAGCVEWTLPLFKGAPTEATS